MLVKSKSIKAVVAANILSYLPFSFLQGMIKFNPLIGFYHLISDEDVPHIKHLYAYKNVKQFRNDLDFILRNFSPLSLSDLLEYLKTGHPLPDNAFLLTFDDGLREAHDIIAPILLEKGIPAIFFMISDFVDNKKLAHDHKASLIIERLRTLNSPALLNKTKDILQAHGYQFTNYKNCILNIKYQHFTVLNEIAKSISLDYQDYLSEHSPYLTSEQLKEMIKKGFSIGAHSIDHSLFSDLSLDQQLHQTNFSISFVRERFTLNYGVFAFPHNDFGVSKDFYTEMHKTGLIDIFFGTAGIMIDRKNHHFQRFSLEMPNLPAEKLVSFQIARRIYKNITGRIKITR